MKAQETLNLAHRTLVLKHIGIDPDKGRSFEGEVGSMFSLGALMRLPPELGAAQQTEDGTLVFMLGHSGLGTLPLA